MMRSRWHWMLLACTVALLCMPAEARSLNLVDNDELELDLVGIANGVYSAEIVEDERDRYGPEVSLARLKLSGQYEEVGGIKIQVDGSSGNLQLLDAVASLDLGSPFHVRLGRFKPTVSPQFLIPAPDVYTSNRALLNSLVPGRSAGVATGADVDLGGPSLKGEIGVFQPIRASFERPKGQLLTARIDLGLPMGLTGHVGYAKHVFDENSLTRPVQGGDGGASFEEVPVVSNDSPLDVAVVFDKNDIYAHLEGVAVLDPPGDQDTIYGGHLLGAYVIGPEGEINVEPTVAYDIIDGADTTHRATVGGNTYFFDTGIEVETHYEFTLVDQPQGQQTIHGIFVALQTVL